MHSRVVLLAAAAAFALRVALVPRSSALLAGARVRQPVCRAAERIAGRTDVESALHSLDGIAEGVALQELGLSPYAGSFLHAPPLLLLALGPLASQPPLLRAFPFVAADALSAACLYWAAGRLRRKGVKALRPSACALLYLWNPCTVAACIGNNWSSLEVCTLLSAFCCALGGKSFFAACFLALAVHSSLHPVALAVPLAILASSSAQCSLRSAALSFALGLLGSLLLITLASIAVLKQQGATTEEWVEGTYLFMLRADDLAPNMGLWWYFFAEIFDHFRSFFLFVFNIQPLLLLLPISLRLARRPVVLTIIATFLITLFKPYGCVADLAFCASLLPLALEEVRHLLFRRAASHSVAKLGRMKALFVASAALLLASVLNPLLMHLWVERYTGNANFVLATCIIHALALTTAVVDLAGASLGHNSD